MFTVPYGKEVEQESTAHSSAKKTNASQAALAGTASRSRTAILSLFSTLGNHTWIPGPSGTPQYRTD